jgi:hypothetical protein
MQVLKAPTYLAKVTNRNGRIHVAIYGPNTHPLFSRTFRKICDVERWLTTLARSGLTHRATMLIEEPDELPAPLPPFGAITVEDERASRRFTLLKTFV